MKKILLFILLYSLTINAQMIPTAGLAGYWPFNGNANDYSGNNNNGIVSDATPFFDRFGNAKKAYRFNGVNSKILVPNSASIDMNNSADFTFAIWEKAY